MTAGHAAVAPPPSALAGLGVLPAQQHLPAAHQASSTLYSKQPGTSTSTGHMLPQDGQVPGPALEALLQTLGHPMPQLGGALGLPMGVADPLAHAASAPVSAPTSRGRAGRTASDARPASSYNARHQQAEARRRSRINERLEALRQLVPHTERANTANFLEEVVGYVQRLQRRVVELERQLGLPPTVQLSNKVITFSEDGTPEQTMLTAGNSDRRAAQSLVQPAMPLLPLPPATAQMPTLPLPPLPPAQPTIADPAAVQAALAAVLQQHTTHTLQQTLPPALQAQIHQLLVQHHAAAAAGAAAAAAASAPLQGTAFSQFNLKLQPPPSQMNTQQASQSLAVGLPPHGGQQRTASGGGAPAASQPSQANRGSDPTPAQSTGSGDSRRQSLQMLADSLGALSAGDASLRSVSLPSKLPLGSAGEATRGGSPGAKRGPVEGIPTDEELAQLHRDLTAGEAAPEGGGKRQRV